AKAATLRSTRMRYVTAPRAMPTTTPILTRIPIRSIGSMRSSPRRTWCKSTARSYHPWSREAFNFLHDSSKRPRACPRGSGHLHTLCLHPDVCKIEVRCSGGHHITLVRRNPEAGDLTPSGHREVGDRLGQLGQDLPRADRNAGAAEKDREDVEVG